MKLEDRVKFSTEKFELLKKNVDNNLLSNKTNETFGEFLRNVCIYVTGSLARDEAGEGSDLDIFSIGNKKSKLYEILLFSELIKINEQLKFPAFSNDGQFLTVFDYSKHEKSIGSPEDDHNNWFTARMLLLLESKCLYNQEKYNEFIDKILTFYFRDCEGKENDNFNLFFILNDILRFWRTLCLNYEVGRTKNKPWKKKNINLKFSRRLMVFSSIIYLCIFKIKNKDGFLEMIKLSPIERLKRSIKKINNEGITEKYKIFENEYNEFLNLKDAFNSSEQALEKDKEDKLRELGKRDTLKELIYTILTSEMIDKDLKHFLVS